MPLEVADMRESKLDQVGFTFLAAAWRGSCQAKLCSYNKSQGNLSAQRGPTDSKKITRSVWDLVEAALGAKLCRFTFLSKSLSDNLSCQGFQDLN